MNLRKLRHYTKNFFGVVVSDPLRKNYLQMVIDLIRYLFTNRALMKQYFPKYLYRKGVENPEDFMITDRINYKSWKLNDPNYITLLDNKQLFESYFSRYQIAVVPNLAYNKNTLFFRNKDFIQINTLQEFSDFISELIAKHSRTRSIFLKPNESSCGGMGIFKITDDTLRSDHTILQKAYQEVVQGDYIFQDAVIQHEEINKINPHCINTIRIDTFTNSDLESRCFSSFMRIGINKAYLDNISSGGVFVGINFQEGTLNPVVFSDFSHGKGVAFDRHPDTGVKFEGFQIPYYKEARQLAEKAAQLVPRIKLIGWDIAIQPEGPVIIEGNHHPGIAFSEVSQKGFRQNPVFMEMYREVASLDKF
jgi:hypothetical protein